MYQLQTTPFLRWLPVDVVSLAPAEGDEANPRKTDSIQIGYLFDPQFRDGDIDLKTILRGWKGMEIEFSGEALAEAMKDRFWFISVLQAILADLNGGYRLGNSRP
jgi:hypothetical protein